MTDNSRRQPGQFSLATLFLAVLVVAFFAWLGREYWLIFGPREGLLWLAFVAIGGLAGEAFTRLISKTG